MKLALNSDAWKMIYRNLREELYRIKVEGPDSRQELQEFFKDYGVIIKTDTDGRWEDVEIVLDEEELTLFLLRWA
jgi:hypothetical protein